MGKIKEILISKESIAKQFFLYIIIGGSCAFLDTLCYIVLTRIIEQNPLQSNFISVNIGIVCSFFLNTFFNFKKTDKLWKRAISFFLIGYCGLAISSLLLHLGVNLLKVNDVIVKFLSIIIVALFQFRFNRVITYSKI